MALLALPLGSGLAIDRTKSFPCGQRLGHIPLSNRDATPVVALQSIREFRVTEVQSPVPSYGSDSVIGGPVRATTASISMGSATASGLPRVVVARLEGGPGDRAGM
jgi:hypothetical protein